MAQQHINLGTPPSGADGDTNRVAWAKAEANFNELYSRSGRNRLINGNFDVWQRGASLAAAASSRYLADRWLTDAVGTTIAPSRQAFANGQTDVPGSPRYYHRAVVSSVAGSGNFARVQQRVEGVSTLAGGSATISFWAKADAPRSIAFESVQVFGAGGSSQVSGIGSAKVNLTTSWQKFTLTFSLPSLAGQTTGSSNDHMQVTFWLDAGSNFNARTASLGQQSGTFDIAQVQLEAGAVATSFDERPIGFETMLCQRFYQVFGGGSSGNTVGLTSFCDASTVGSNSYITISFPQMRAPPAATLGTFAVANCNQPTVYGIGASSLTLQIIALAAGRFAARSDVATAPIALDAEL